MVKDGEWKILWMARMKEVENKRIRELEIKRT